MRDLLFHLGMIFLALNALAAAEQRTALREYIEVNRGTILLSDLLADSAPEHLRAVSEKIKLGRAPEPGSIRVLEGAQIAAAAPDLQQEFVLPEHITIRRIGYPISHETIWKAISSFLGQHGWASSQIPERPELAWSATVARNEEPVLQATNASWDFHEAVWEISMRCVDHTLCGKFLVRMPGANLAGNDLLATAARSHVAEIVGTAFNSRKARLPLLTKPGKPATLILAGDGFRITLPVICLQPGASGQRIRVRDPVSKRILVAEVVSAETLRAVADIQ